MRITGSLLRYFFKNALDCVNIGLQYLFTEICMTVPQQKVYLLTEVQRDALLSYLQERPYKEVAAGVEFLLNATTAMLNVQAESAEETPKSAEETSESTLDGAVSEGDTESV